MDKQPRITFGKFGWPADRGATAATYVYADGKCVGEIWRHSQWILEYGSRNPETGQRNRPRVACYIAQIWMDDAGNNDPAFIEHARDNRGNVVQTPAQAKAALRRRIAEHFESLESDAA